MSFRYPVGLSDISVPLSLLEQAVRTHNILLDSQPTPTQVASSSSLIDGFLDLLLEMRTEMMRMYQDPLPNQPPQQQQGVPPQPNNGVPAVDINGNTQIPV